MITTNNDTKSAAQSILPNISSLYVSFAYKRRFNGSIMTERSVDIAVIVTERARSALNKEHHLI